MPIKSTVWFYAKTQSGTILFSVGHNPCIAFFSSYLMTGMWFCPIKLYFCIVIYLLKEETFKEAPSDLDWVSFQKGEHWKFPFTSGCWLTGLASAMIRGKTNFLFEEWPLKRPPRTFQRPCCPVQDWLDSVDGIVPKAKVILLPILW